MVHTDDRQTMLAAAAQIISALVHPIALSGLHLPLVGELIQKCIEKQVSLMAVSFLLFEPENYLGTMMSVKLGCCEAKKQRKA